MALFDGSTFKFSVRMDEGPPIKGTVTIDLKTNSQHGSYSVGDSDRQEFFTGSVRVEGDLWCRKEDVNPERCFSVYTDGGYIYDTDENGVVVSVNQKQ